MTINTCLCRLRFEPCIPFELRLVEEGISCRPPEKETDAESSVQPPSITTGICDVFFKAGFMGNAVLIPGTDESFIKNCIVDCAVHMAVAVLIAKQTFTLPIADVPVFMLEPGIIDELGRSPWTVSFEILRPVPDFLASYSAGSSFDSQFEMLTAPTMYLPYENDDLLCGLAENPSDDVKERGLIEVLPLLPANAITGSVGSYIVIGEIKSEEAATLPKSDSYEDYPTGNLKLESSGVENTGVEELTSSSSEFRSCSSITIDGNSIYAQPKTSPFDGCSVCNFEHEPFTIEDADVEVEEEERESSKESTESKTCMSERRVVALSILVTILTSAAFQLIMLALCGGSKHHALNCDKPATTKSYFVGNALQTNWSWNRLFPEARCECNITCPQLYPSMGDEVLMRRWLNKHELAQDVGDVLVHGGVRNINDIKLLLESGIAHHMDQLNELDMLKLQKAIDKKTRTDNQESWCQYECLSKNKTRGKGKNTKSGAVVNKWSHNEAYPSEPLSQSNKGGHVTLQNSSANETHHTNEFRQASRGCNVTLKNSSANETQHTNEFRQGSNVTLRNPSTNETHHTNEFCHTNGRQGSENAFDASQGTKCMMKSGSVANISSFNDTNLSEPRSQSNGADNANANETRHTNELHHAKELQGNDKVFDASQETCPSKDQSQCKGEDTLTKSGGIVDKLSRNDTYVAEPQSGGNVTLINSRANETHHTNERPHVNALQGSKKALDARQETFLSKNHTRGKSGAVVIQSTHNVAQSQSNGAGNAKLNNTRANEPHHGKELPDGVKAIELPDGEKAFAAIILFLLCAWVLAHVIRWIWIAFKFILRLAAAVCVLAFCVAFWACLFLFWANAVNKLEMSFYLKIC